jgi:nuclear pore complex protein Nup85
MKSRFPFSFGSPDTALTEFRSDLSLRDFHILAYAEYLYSDPALWRITIDYMYSCSDIGKLRADTILTRVPLQLRQQGQATNPETIERIRSGDIIGVLKDVNECCLQYNREGVRRIICKAGSRPFL